MLVVTSAILGALIGAVLAFAVHGLTWQVRFRSLALTIGLGLLGAGTFAYFAVELFSPFIGLPIIFPVLFLVLVLAAVSFLVIVQSRAIALPWWRLAAAQFVNVLLLFILVLGSVWLRDALVLRLYPDYGEAAFELIHTAQTWLAAALILGVFALDTLRGFRPGGSSPRQSL
jgi:hypothetical protein